MTSYTKGYAKLETRKKMQQANVTGAMTSRYVQNIRTTTISPS